MAASAPRWVRRPRSRLADARTARGVGDSRPCWKLARVGARFIVCEMGLRSLGIDRTGLRTDVPFTIAGIVTLLEETKPGMHLVSL